MELVRNSPLKLKIKAISESIVTCELTTIGSKSRIKIDMVIHIYYKGPIMDAMGIARTSIVSSDIQSVYTSTNDEVHMVKIKTPKFDTCIKSELVLSLAPGQRYDSVSIGDVKVAERLSHIQKVHQMRAAMAVHNLKPEIYTQQTQQSVPTIDKIILVSTWHVKCGIAIYTEDLYSELNKLYPNLFMVNPINGGVLQNNIKANLTHLQHEFGIMPKPPPIDGKTIMTWHTIPSNIKDTIKRFESELDIVAHIIPCEGAREYMKTSKDVYTINLGSKLMPNINKEEARALLNIENIDIPIGFVFGFQSPNKNYNRLADAAKNTNIHLIISGSLHQCGYKSSTSNNKNVTILGRYLTDSDIDLYALASDILLFDYVDQSHYSSSSALHRTVGAGRPVVCCNTKHFNDIKEEDGALKFNNIGELEQKIREALERKDELGTKILEFAKRTSREEVAKKHMEIYKRYVDI